MKKVFCKFCGKYVTHISYLAELSDLTLKRLNDIYRQEHPAQELIDSKALGCQVAVDEENILFIDTVRHETITNYSMSGEIQADMERMFNLFSVTADPEILEKDSCAKQLFQITQATPEDDDTSPASIDGKYLFFDGRYASLLSCGECHMRLETNRVCTVQDNHMSYYASKVTTDKNVNIMFIGPPSSGKTVLLLALLQELFKDQVAKMNFHQLNDRYVAHYYNSLRRKLFNKKEAPDTTGTIQPPVTLGLQEYRVTFLDTMGEIVGNKTLDALGILTCSDAIVIINPLCIERIQEDSEEPRIDIQKTKAHLERTIDFTGNLIGAVQTKLHKPTMLLFNKCDLFLQVAQEIMLDSSQESLRKNSQQLQLLRKFFFSSNAEVVLTRICQALIDQNSPDFAELLDNFMELYTNCCNLSDNGVRIQCISPLGSSDPKKLREKEQYYVYDFIHMIIELCKEISK